MRHSQAFLSAINPVRASVLGLLELSESRALLGEPTAVAPLLAELERERVLAGAFTDEPIMEAVENAGLLLYAAEDHISALCRLLADVVPTIYAHATMGRSAMECAARCAWLAESGIGAEERVRRFLVEQLYSVDRLIELDPNQQMSTPDVARLFRSKRQEILDHARRLGMLRPSTKGKPAGIRGFGRPGATRAIADLLAGGKSDSSVPNATYPIYSAVAHGTHFGLLRSIDHESMTEGERAGLGRHQAAVYVSADDVVLLLGSVQTSYIVAASAFRRLMGRDTPEWRTAIANCSATINRALDVADARQGQAGSHLTTVQAE